MNERMSMTYWEAFAMVVGAAIGQWPYVPHIDVIGKTVAFFLLLCAWIALSRWLRRHLHIEWRRDTTDSGEPRHE